MALVQFSSDTSSVEGGRDAEIKVLLATSEHREGILRLMREAFLPREPVEAALGTTWEEAGASLTEEVIDALSQACSFVAVHPTEGVVGFRTSKYIRIDEKELVEDPNELLVVKGEAPKLRVFQHVVVHLMRGWKEEFAKHGFRSALQFYSLCVDERFTNRGLGKRMIEESVRLAERMEVDCIFAVATNRISQHVLQKAGFTAWRSIEYEDIRNEATGKPWVIPNEGSTCIKWMVKVSKRLPMSG